MAPYSSVTSARGGAAADSVEQGVDGAGGIGVEHEELAEVGVGVAEEFEAVLLGAGEGLLVAVDDAHGVVLDGAEGDEALADETLAGIGHGEFLEIGVDGRLRVAGQDAGGLPVVKVRGGAGVDVGGGVIGREALAEDQAHEVVGAE